MKPHPRFRESAGLRGTHQGACQLTIRIHPHAQARLTNDWELCVTESFTAYGPGNEQTLVPTYVAIIGTPAYTQGRPAPYVYNVNREILDQNHHPLTGVRYVEESYNPNPASANSPPTPVCTSNRIDTNNVNSNDQGIFAPDLYYLTSGAPNPCSLASVQHFKVGGLGNCSVFMARALVAPSALKARTCQLFWITVGDAT
jgi:hypothetical protein